MNRMNRDDGVRCEDSANTRPFQHNHKVASHDTGIRRYVALCRPEKGLNELPEKHFKQYLHSCKSLNHRQLSCDMVPIDF